MYKCITFTKEIEPNLGRESSAEHSNAQVRIKLHRQHHSRSSHVRSSDENFAVGRRQNRSDQVAQHEGADSHSEWRHRLTIQSFCQCKLDPAFLCFTLELSILSWN